MLTSRKGSIEDMCEAVAEQGSLAFEARGGLEGSGREKVTPRRGQPCTAQVHCSLQERQAETRRDPGLGACLGVVEAEGSNVLGVPVSLPYTEGQRGRYKVHNSVLWWERRRPLGRGGGKCGTVCALPPWARLLCWDVLGCALAEEDQGCRNGQMRNSKETVGYMADI